MGWLSKVLGIDKKVNAAEAQRKQAEADAAAARKLALDQSNATLAAQKELANSMKTMQQNAQKLTDANSAGANMADVSNVIAGGTAEAVSPLRKKQKTPTLSNSLGINI